MEMIKIFDTTLRDGEQSPGASMNTEEKIKLALQLERLGVDIIEAGFAAASPGDFEAISRIAEAVKESTICSLARAVPKDIEAAAKALEKANISLEQIDAITPTYGPGLVGALLVGLSYAKGKYIIFLDSDDYLIESNALEKIKTKTTAEPDVIIYGYKKLFESNGSFGSSVCDFPKVKDDIPPARYLKELLLSGTYSGAPWSKVVKAEFLKNNNIEFKPGLISEDIDWYLQIMIKVKSFAAINEVLYVYRLRSGSISHGGAKLNSLDDNLWIQRTWSEKIMQADIASELKYVLLCILAYYLGNVMILYSNYGSKVRKQYKEQIVELIPLFEYAVTPRSIAIKNCCKILGVSITAIMLHLASRLKRRV